MTLKRVLIALMVLILLPVVLVVGMFLHSNPWNVLCPGIQSHNMDTVEPSLRKKVNKIVQTLKDEGYEFQISTFRSPEKQQCYHAISKQIKKYTGQNGLTTTSKGCHNHTVDKKPASLAVDLHSYTGTTEDQAKFYKRLRTLANANGLESGGSWRKTNPIWANYGLGWDPGHVQVRGCKSKL